ncbi:sugar transporter domain-containing protein [Sarocladium implicatum]|nr:sugar transporter domain-containing protein [Sarocladium implicatum]
MGFFSRLTLAKYGQNIKSAPSEVIFNKRLICTALVFATAAVPQTWDQGSASAITSLPAFQHHFGISSGGNASQVRDFLSLVYLGEAIGAGLSFFFNDRLGRLWSMRAYVCFWAIGQLIAILAPNAHALSASRIICGSGIGALTVTIPMTLAEIAPSEIRGLITSWYAVFMGLAHFVSTFCVLGVFKNMTESNFQFQVIWFSPMIYMALVLFLSFFIHESPRWLFMVGRRNEAIENLVALRGLPATHPRVDHEIKDIEQDISEGAELDLSPHTWTGMRNQVRQTFTIKSNFRRLVQAMILYALPQLSGGNSIGSYFVPILTSIGIAGGRSYNMMITGFYAMTKFFYALIVSFFIVDVLGRRMSLLVGTSTQVITNIYISAYTKAHQDGPVSTGASQAALAAVFIHAFGFSVGLLILPYIFGGELFPNRIRSFAASFSQCFHWLFRYAIGFAVPSILESMHQWGAFVFFGGWCFVAFVYTFFFVPETSALEVEELSALFEGPWYNAYKLTRKSLKTRRSADAESIGQSIQSEDGSVKAGGVEVDEVARRV